MAAFVCGWMILPWCCVSAFTASMLVGRLPVSRWPRASQQRFSFSLTSRLDDLMDEVLGSPNPKERRSNPSIDSKPLQNQSSWKLIDWTNQKTSTTAIPPSPVDKLLVRGRLVHVKRDDQLRLPGSQISGNKARKMLALSSMEDFPACVVSYGGPQSNAMLALAAVVHFQNERAKFSAEDPNRRRFVYYTKTLPRFLRNQPNGNLFRALSLGMEIVELASPEYNELFGGDFGGSPTPPLGLSPPVPGDSVWVPQGGACSMAQAGTRQLAKEILDYWSENGQGRPLSVIVPGGTCSTAALLHSNMEQLKQDSTDPHIQIVVVPCVGDAGYARRQMLALNAHLENAPHSASLPTILPPSPDASYFGQQSRAGSNDYFRFGEPNAAILDVFREMEKEYDLQLDLLYGAPSWAVLFRHWRCNAEYEEQGSGATNLLVNGELMYIHSGGLEGINSQLLRYQYKGFVSMEEVQWPGRVGR